MTAVTDQNPQETLPEPRGRGQIVALGLILLLVGGLLIAWMMISFVLPGQLSFHSGATVPAGTELKVDAPDAAIRLVQGTDGSVRVVGDGHYVTAAPTVSANTNGQVTTVRASCPTSGECELEVTISVPAALNVEVNAVTGHVEASGLHGRLSLSSTDGSIDVHDSSGPLAIQAVNGSIDVDSSSSKEVNAQGENGAVSLKFLDAPTNATATSTNGAISVRVPQTMSVPVTYRVVAQSEHGGTKVSVPTEDTSSHVITATSTNGAVKVFM